MIVRDCSRELILPDWPHSPSNPVVLNPSTWGNFRKVLVQDGSSLMSEIGYMETASSLLEWACG